MYPISDAFLAAITANTRKYTWSGTLKSNAGTEYPFTNDDIVKGSGYITRQIAGSTEIELGTVYAAELGIALYLDVDRYTLYNGTIDLYFHLTLADETVETIPMGIFEISEAERNADTVSIKGYDYMLRFDKALSLNVSSGTAYDFINAACTECHVEFAQTREEIGALPNGTTTLGIYSDNDMETWRDLLYYVAQVIGCYCVIDRSGKLELKPFSNVATLTVPAKERYTSTYSDFVTRYTAVSSTNVRTQEAEYYALDPDDALTMNLGSNPLLQFGLKSTRERICRNILGAISSICYVPFGSDTIGNPALDPGDVLVFSGGHADSTKISCITEITYKINGKHTLKCVGKNPRLAAAKSKSDKNLIGLLNTVSATEIVVYTFENASPYSIHGSSAVMIINIDFAAKENTVAWFQGQMLLSVTLDEESESCISEISYVLNGDEVTTWYPKELHSNGEHTLNLFFPIPQVIENTANTLEVRLKATGGTVDIAELNIRAILCGQGLAAAGGDWNGRISVTDSIPAINVDSVFTYKSITDSVTVIKPASTGKSITQVIGLISLAGSFGYDALNEKVTATEVVKTFSMNRTYPGSFDHTKIEITEDGIFRMICNYLYVSQEAEINYGALQKLPVNTSQFERVESEVISNAGE